MRRGARAAALLAAALLAGALRPADTDNPLWRAEHDLLLGAARAGARLVVVGDRGHVLLSDDDGQSWRLRQAPTDELLDAVLFISPREGWAVGQDERVIHTTDGGESWTEQHAAPASDQSLFSIARLGPRHLFASGAYDLTLETTDGTTWKEGKIPDLDDDYHLNCAVARGDELLVTGEAGHAFLRQQGKWLKIPVPYDGSQFGCLLDSQGRFYSFGLRGSLFRAVAGVAGWKRIATPGDRSIFGGVNLSDGRLAMVGANGLAMIFDPRDDTFTKLDAGTGATLSGVTETARGTLVAVGDDGLHIVSLTPSTTGSATQ